MQWIPFVMVRVTAFFTAGILTGIYFPTFLPPETATVFLIILALVYLISWLGLRRQQIIRLISGFVAMIALFLMGLVVVDVRNEPRDPSALSQQTDATLAYRVRIVSPTDRRERSWRRTGEVQSILTTTGWMDCSGKLLLYWPLTENVDTIHYGDELVVQGSPQSIQGPQNPNEFDYQTYLARRNIFHQHYIRSGQWSFVAESNFHGPFYYAVEARNWTLKVIDRLVRGDRERAIMGAFVIGVTDGIDDDLKQAYAAGGAMHALAVSGMHVSILYGVMLFLLRPFESKRGGPWAIAMISLLVLWMYGFVTGLTPSILRAVTMFSFVALAKPLRRTTSILNTLAASAFFLLLFDPWLICSAGFQLSYLAVLGIVLLYRPIYNVWEPTWVAMDWIWQITCVSIAAQIATLPVTLYYFHQFPLYFLLANLFVIPASTLILLGGILLLILSPIPVLADWLARILEWLIWVLNEGLFLVGALPSSVIQPIPLTLVQSFCLGAMVIAIFMLFHTRKFQWLVMLSFIVLFFSGSDWMARSMQTDQFVVHRINNHTSLEWRTKEHAFSVLDSGLARAPGKVQYHILPGRMAQRVEKVRTQIVGKPCELFRFQSLTFLYVSSRESPLAPRASVDYLIIGNNAVRSLESLSRNLTFGYVILDSSNSTGYASRLLAEARQMNVPCHSVLTQGAYIREWKTEQTTWQ